MTLGSFLTSGAPHQEAKTWVEPMRQVHARFKGTPGTFAQFGDSITVTMAYWAPLAFKPRNLSPAGTNALERVKQHQQPACWNRWKGPEFGSQGSMTIRWARQNIDGWLARLNPEVALIMFGSNDVGQMEVGEYATLLREVVARCLTNGTVVILSTMPPLSGKVEKARRFADAARQIARENQLPLIDYFREIQTRRPDDWDGSLAQFKDVPGDAYQVPTLVARDGVHPSNPKAFVNDYSEEALRQSGYSLRNYLTLTAYAEVIARVLKP
jgi:lysophospholipase L1-like esterase